MDTNTHEEENTDYANGIDEKLREEAGPQLCSLLVPVLMLATAKRRSSAALQLRKRSRGHASRGNIRVHSWLSPKKS